MRVFEAPARTTAPPPLRATMANRGVGVDAVFCTSTMDVLEAKFDGASLSQRTAKPCRWQIAMPMS